MRVGAVREIITALWQYSFLRFLVVGGVNTLFGYGVFALGLFLGIPRALALLIATILGVIFNFHTIGWAVFNNLDFRLLFRFVGVYAIVYGTNLALLEVWCRVIGVAPLLGQALSLPPVVLLAFWMMRALVFEGRPESGARAGRGPRDRRVLIWIFAVAALLRLAVLVTWDDSRPLPGIEDGNVKAALTMSAGHGPLRKTHLAVMNRDASGNPIDIVAAAKERQRLAERLDREHPYPADTQGWIPDTVHTFTYAAILHGLYELFNYDGMLTAMRILQVLFDALTAIFIFLFARNLFGRSAAGIAAWIYVCLPPPMFQNLILTNHALTPCLAALILWLVSSARPGRRMIFVAAGVGTGLAALIRPDFLLFPFVLLLILWIHRRSAAFAFQGFALIFLLTALIYAPWPVWTARHTGKPVLTATTGAGLYAQLGLLPDNPWGIVGKDSWAAKDAYDRGFEHGPWSVEAHAFYTELYWKRVAQHPLYVAKLVLVHRLPFAVCPPYLIRDPRDRPSFRFSELRYEEGLSNWGIVRKYPLRFVQLMWPEALMVLLSGILALNLAGLILVRRRDWRLLAWLILPWGYHATSVSLLKNVEPQNMLPALVVQSVGLGYTLSRWFAVSRPADQVPTGS
jgi:putative flippase GtrA